MATCLTAVDLTTADGQRTLNIDEMYILWEKFLQKTFVKKKTMVNDGSFEAFENCQHTYLFWKILRFQGNVTK